MMLESQFVLDALLSAKLATQPPTAPVASLRIIESLAMVFVFVLLDGSKLLILIYLSHAQNVIQAATLAHFWPPNVPIVTQPPTVSWDMILLEIKSVTVSVDIHVTLKVIVFNQTVLLTLTVKHA